MHKPQSSNSNDVKKIQNLSNHPGDGISRVIEGLEKVISTPLDNFLNMVKLTSSFVLSTVLNHTPAEHSNSKRLRKIKLNGIPSIVKTPNQILGNTRGSRFAILQTRISPPRNVIMLG